MPMGLRDYKQSGAGEYFHLYNRGNGRGNVFIDEEDFKFFTLKLNQNLYPELFKPKRLYSKPLPSNSFSLISYCLMPNHFHFLIRQNMEIPTSKLILKVCTSYSKFFSKKYDKPGHLFQDQFKQVLVDDNSYLLWLSAYIHQNPKVAGLVSDNVDYKWSSYASYLNLNSDLIKCDSGVILDQFKEPKDYLEFMKDSYDTIKSKKDIEHLLLD